MPFLLFSGLLSLVICHGSATPTPLATDSDAQMPAASVSFLVNSDRDRDQQRPAVARAPDGSFVVAWDSDGQDGSVAGVYARRYDAQGIPRGGEFLVHVTTRHRQYAPRISIAPKSVV